MITFFLGSILIAVCAVVFVAFKETGGKKYYTKFPTWTILSAVIVLFCMIVFLGSQRLDAIGDAEKVITVTEKTDNGGITHYIYYDEAADMYFTLTSDLWNPLKLQCREYLETELVEEYIEHQKAIENIHLFD